MERAGASVGSAGAGRAQVNAGAVRAILHPRDSRLEPITLPVDGAARTLGRHNLRSILEWAQAISVSRSQLSLTFNAATGECTVELLGKAVSVVLRRDKPPQTLSAARDGHIGSASAARATLRHGDVLILYERRTRWSRRRSSSGRLQGRETGPVGVYELQVTFLICPPPHRARPLPPLNPPPASPPPTILTTTRVPTGEFVHSVRRSLSRESSPAPCDAAAARGA